jgi:hypothetical protein
MCKMRQHFQGSEAWLIFVQTHYHFDTCRLTMGDSSSSAAPSAQYSVVKYAPQPYL